MKIDLTELLQKVGNEADIEENSNVSFPEDELTLTQPIKIKLHLVNTGTVVLVKGKAETEAELECSRCLKKFKTPLSIEIDEEFALAMPEPQHKKSKEVELHKEDFVFPIEANNTIDLTEIIRQNLLLALPMTNLCSPDCQGINAERS